MQAVIGLGEMDLYRLTERRGRRVVKTNLTPTKIVCFGRTYADHVEEMREEFESEPMLFLKPPSALIPDGGTIVIPPQSNDVHHEVELAIVIGRRTSWVSESHALESVYGYSILLDISARDLESEAKKRGLPYTLSKGFDTFAPFYHVVNRSAVKNPQNLPIRLKVNGVLRQNSNTKNMMFTIPHLVSYVSTVMTLERGDIIATGTPSGTGPLKPGDKIEAAIDGIGVLKVDVTARTVDSAAVV